MRESAHIDIDKVESWHDRISAYLLDGDCAKLGSHFRVDMLSSFFSDVVFTRLSGTSYQFERTEKHIKKSNQHTFLVILQLRGNTSHVQDGREVFVGPGTIVCGDATRPLQLTHYDEFERLIVQIPRQIILSSLGPTERFTAVDLTRGNAVSNVLAPFLQHVDAIGHQISPHVAGLLSQTAMSLVITTLAEQYHLKLDDAGWHRLSLLFRAEEYIKAHSRNPILTPEDVASALQIRVRYLQDIFTILGKKPSEYIWQCRLENGKVDLVNPCFGAVAIGEIALHSGFSNPAHFSHTFKKAYGISPAAFRDRSLQVGANSG